MPDACPSCGVIRRYIRLPCEDCPKDHLGEAVASSGFGPLIDQINLFSAWIQKGGTLTLDDVTPQECRALRILWEEQDKHTADQMREAQRRNHADSKISATYKTRPV